MTQAPPDTRVRTLAVTAMGLYRRGGRQTAPTPWQTQAVSRRWLRGTLHALGSAWFLGLAILMLSGVIRQADLANHGAAAFQTWSAIASRGCLASFYLILWVLLLIRPSAVSGNAAPLPVMFAFLGTYMPWLIPLLPGDAGGMVRQTLSAACLLVGGGLILVTVLYLGGAFSLIPQARRLVTSGPYRLIRHPLYLAEELSVLGAVFQDFSVFTGMIFLLHCAVQIQRIRFEETLLTDIFPEYKTYAAATPCLVPRLWRGDG